MDGSGRINDTIGRLHQRAAEAERAGADMADNVLRSVGRAKEAIHEVGDVASSAMAGAAQAGRSVARQVEQQPLAALAVVGLAGFALGWVMRGSSR